MCVCVYPAPRGTRRMTRDTRHATRDTRHAVCCAHCLLTKHLLVTHHLLTNYKCYEYSLLITKVHMQFSLLSIDHAYVTFAGKVKVAASK